MRRLLYAIAGMLIPIRITSRRYLADRLARFGVAVGSIPQPCLQELADDAVATAKSIAKMTRRGWREIVTDHLDGEAVNIADILDGRFRDHGALQEYGDRIRSTLLKHGVRPSARSD